MPFCIAPSAGTNPLDIAYPHRGGKRLTIEPLGGERCAPTGYPAYLSSGF
jgi:hypothetical protein